MDLWRLGVSGNEWWTGGDQRQTSLKAKDGRLTIQDLPAGQYRVHTHFARRHSQSPPAFWVEGEQTSVLILVEMPTTERIRLHLVDIHGTPIRSSKGDPFEIRPYLSPRHYRGQMRPPWLKRRMPRDEAVRFLDPAGGASMGSSRGRWTQVQATDASIELGERRGDPRAFETLHRWRIRKGAGPPMTVELIAAGVGDYVVIVPDPTEILQGASWPAGIEARQWLNKAKFELSAVPIDFSRGQSISSEWSKCQIALQLEVEGFKPIHVKWKPERQPQPPIHIHAE